MRNLIVFDTETNGLSSKCSILSISAIRILNNKYDSEYTRYYYPVEPFDRESVKINGLDYNSITKLRNTEKYPRYFKDDFMSFYNFIKECTHFVGHNIAFDMRFIKPIELSHVFCTMNANKDVLKLKKRDNTIKQPKLQEAADYYGIDFDSNDLHGSSYDTRLTLKVFIAMNKHPISRPLVANFLNKNGIPPILKNSTYLFSFENN